jgi:hypothetical protein
MSWRSERLKNKMRLDGISGGTMAAILQVRDLVKKYGDLAAVKGISFDIQEDEICSLLGPNGAGKTTTISVLSTLYAPTSGDATIDGYSVSKEPMAVCNVIGLVPQELALCDDLIALGTQAELTRQVGETDTLVLHIDESQNGEALAAATLGTTLGTFAKTESQASGLSIMAGMVTALLGGCWYPLELFPKSVQHIVQILPTTWAMRGLLDIVLRGQGLVTVLPIAGVLAAFAAVFFAVGIWRFRYE